MPDDERPSSPQQQQLLLPVAAAEPVQRRPTSILQHICAHSAARLQFTNGHFFCFYGVANQRIVAGRLRATAYRVNPARVGNATYIGRTHARRYLGGGVADGKDSTLAAAEGKCSRMREMSSNQRPHSKPPDIDNNTHKPTYWSFRTRSFGRAISRSPVSRWSECVNWR